MRFLWLLFLVSSFVFADEAMVSDYNATLNANTLYMTYNDYNFLHGLAGCLIGFVYAVGLVWVSLNISKGR